MTTILLVEDDKNQRLLYEQELRHEGYEVVAASNGKEALEEVQEKLPDIVIMDINMPKMDGIEAMGRILVKTRRFRLSLTLLIAITKTALCHGQRMHI